MLGVLRLNPRVSGARASKEIRWTRRGLKPVTRGATILMLAVGLTTACRDGELTGPMPNHPAEGDPGLIGSPSAAVVEVKAIKVSPEVAAADPDFQRATKTTFPVTEAVYNTCRGELVVLNGYLQQHVWITTEGDGGLRYRMRTWKQTWGVTGSATVLVDDDGRPDTPPVLSTVKYHNQEAMLDYFEVGPTGVPFESRQVSLIRLRRQRNEGERLLPGDDLFVYAEERVKVDATGIPQVESNFRTECR